MVSNGLAKDQRYNTFRIFSPSVFKEFLFLLVVIDIHNDIVMIMIGIDDGIT